MNNLEDLVIAWRSARKRLIEIFNDGKHPEDVRFAAIDELAKAEYDLMNYEGIGMPTDSGRIM